MVGYQPAAGVAFPAFGCGRLCRRRTASTPVVRCGGFGNHGAGGIFFVEDALQVGSHRSASPVGAKIMRWLRLAPATAAMAPPTGILAGEPEAELCPKQVK